MKKNNSKREFIFWAVAAQGSGISGGDKIFIELARKWSKKYKVRIIVCEDGFEMCKRLGITKGKIEFNVIRLGALNKVGFFISYCLRIIVAIRQAIFLQMNRPETVFIYSASEFWMDSIPCFILKLRYQKIRWVAAWYQTAPNPVHGFFEGSTGSRHRFKAFIYWLVQILPRLIIICFSDYVFVNNENEEKHFDKFKRAGQVFVMLGAIDVEKIKKWVIKLKRQKQEQKYDAIFQGRFHVQKGVLELIKIWKMVVKKRPTAKLAMIGDGPLMNKAKQEINKLGINKNIDLLGFVIDGSEKYEIFSKSKIVIHPSLFDSGGMAAMEAMAFGLPCVSFDLLAYRSYYPKGLVKVKIGDLKEFAGTVIRLLEDKKYYKTFSQQGRSFLEKKWSWNTRTDSALNFLTQDE